MSSCEEPAAEKKKLPLALRIFGWLVFLGGLGCLAIFALGLLGRLSWWLNLLAQLRPQCAIGLVILGLPLLLLRGFRWRACVLLIAAGLIAGTLLPWYWGREPAPGPRRLRVLLFNVGGWNRRYGEVLSYIERSDADIVVVLEIRPHWAEMLATMEEYRWRRLQPRPDNFGIGVYGKTPFAAEIRYWGGFGAPSVDLVVERDGVPLRIIGTHPVPPMGPVLFDLQREQLSAMAAVCAAEEGRLLLVGDLNCAPWTEDFEEFLSAAVLRDGSRGFGYHETWNWWRLPGLGLPIDHTLVGGEVSVVSREVGPWCGSDHRPVLVEVGW